jgi:FKBP-type peptidyl-prolyl cis-trans isomerase FkpA
MMKHFLALLGLLAVLVFPPGCGGNDGPTTPTPAGPPFSQTDLVVGTGSSAAVNNFVTVSYTGWLYDASRPEAKGTQFDSSASYQFRLGTGAVIRGWDVGVIGMRVGGQRRLVIPPDLAYGRGGQGPIPPNATLVFDITLLNVQ